MELAIRNRRDCLQMSISEWEQRKREKELAYIQEEITRKQRERMERALNRSGLGEAIKVLTFDNFQTGEAWQLKAKSICEKYAAAPEGWLLLSGPSGCGKTHLCTAVVGKLMADGIPVHYMLYRETICKLKPGDYYEPKLLEQVKKADVVYIDDLFKGGASDADIRAMFELIDFRYRANKRTIISTELSVDALKAIDEAVAGRIMQKAKKVLINAEPGRNYRIGVTS